MSWVRFQGTLEREDNVEGRFLERNAACSVLLIIPVLSSCKILDKINAPSMLVVFIFSPPLPSFPFPFPSSLLPLPSLPLPFFPLPIPSSLFPFPLFPFPPFPSQLLSMGSNGGTCLQMAQGEIWG